MCLGIETAKFAYFLKDRLFFGDAVADKPATYDRARPATTSPAVNIDEAVFIQRGINLIEDLDHEFRGRNIEVPDGHAVAFNRRSAVRESGNYEQWVDYFLKGVVDIAGAAMDTARQILELQTNHRRLLWEKKISSPIAVGILEQLFYTPTVSIAKIAERFNISYQAASTLVAQLEKVKILRETTGRKRDKRYVYSDYLNILAEGTKI